MDASWPPPCNPAPRCSPCCSPATGNPASQHASGVRQPVNNPTSQPAGLRANTATLTHSILTPRPLRSCTSALHPCIDLHPGIPATLRLCTPTNLRPSIHLYLCLNSLASLRLCSPHRPAPMHEAPLHQLHLDSLDPCTSRRYELTHTHPRTFPSIYIAIPSTAMQQTYASDPPCTPTGPLLHPMLPCAPTTMHFMHLCTPASLYHYTPCTLGPLHPCITPAPHNWTLPPHAPLHLCNLPALAPTSRATLQPYICGPIMRVLTWGRRHKR